MRRATETVGSGPLARTSVECGLSAESEELLARCRRGDVGAWDELVQRYQRLVFSVALRNGLGREDAADVTQATFLALLESLDRVRGHDRVAPWLMTVCRRSAWAVRSRAARETPDAEAEIDRPDDDDAFGRWEQVTVLHEALDVLGSPCRDLLDALYLDPSEPSYQQVADRLGRRIGGIGPLRARCLERLREIVGEETLN